MSLKSIEPLSALSTYQQTHLEKPIDKSGSPKLGGPWLIQIIRPELWERMPWTNLGVPIDNKDTKQVLTLSQT